MAVGVWMFLGWMAIVSIIAFAFFVWGWEHDQFSDLEGTARRMLHDEKEGDIDDR